MAFFVEMIRGRHHNVDISDEEKARLRGTRNRNMATFQCTQSVWDAVLFIGRSFHWKPAGCIMRLAGRTPKPNFKDYSCPTTIKKGTYKVFLADDALALSQALQAFLKAHAGTGNRRFSKTLQSKGITPEALDVKMRWITTGFLQKFISFLKRGEFTFGRADLTPRKIYGILVPFTPDVKPRPGFWDHVYRWFKI